MRFLASMFLSFALFLSAFLAQEASAAVVGMSAYSKVIYISAAADTTTKSARNSGFDYASPKGFFDGDLLAIPANVVLTNMYVVVDEAVVGPTAFNLGDDDTASGFIASSSPLAGPETMGSTGLKHYNLDYKGAYFKGGTIVTNGWQGKYYSATGKELKLDVTGTASAGKIRVFVFGYAVGKAQ